jgi:hypothetical protein
MSQAHAQTYYDLVAKDSSQLEALGAGVNSAEEFIARAIAAAQQQGLEFTAQEANDYLEAQHTEKPDGELSDQQLEGVAGGKRHIPSLNSGVLDVLFRKPPAPGPVGGFLGTAQRHAAA